MSFLKRQPLHSSRLLLCGSKGSLLPDLPIFKHSLEIQIFMYFSDFGNVETTKLFGNLLEYAGYHFDTCDTQDKS